MQRYRYIALIFVLGAGFGVGLCCPSATDVSAPSTKINAI